jgi:hypothetical protein
MTPEEERTIAALRDKGYAVAVIPAKLLTSERMRADVEYLMINTGCVSTDRMEGRDERLL